MYAFAFSRNFPLLTSHFSLYIFNHQLMEDTIMNVLIYAIPVIAVFAAGYAAMRFFKQNGSGAKALKVNFAVVALVFAVCMFGAMSAMAAEDKTEEAPKRLSRIRLQPMILSAQRIQPKQPRQPKLRVLLWVSDFLRRLFPPASAVSAAVLPLLPRLRQLSALPARIPRRSVRR